MTGSARVLGVGVMPSSSGYSRGEAAGRGVDNVTVTLQHNFGLGGGCVVTLYEKVA